MINAFSEALPFERDIFLEVSIKCLDALMTWKQAKLLILKWCLHIWRN